VIPTSAVPPATATSRLSGWAKLPCTWQLEGSQHRALANRQTGEVITALKIYLALCLYANFKPNGRFSVSGCAQRSIGDFSHALKLSRPSVVKGFRVLRERGIVERLGGRPEIYRIAHYETAPNWTRLPKEYLVGGSRSRQIARLAGLPSRGRVAANALRLYIYVASILNRNTNAATVGYARLMEILGLDRTAVSNAVSLLIEHQLITVRNNKMAMVIDELYRGNLPKEVYDSTNSYFLRGFSNRKSPASEGTAGR